MDKKQKMQQLRVFAAEIRLETLKVIACLLYTSPSPRDS